MCSNSAHVQEEGGGEKTVVAFFRILLAFPSFLSPLSLPLATPRPEEKPTGQSERQGKEDRERRRKRVDAVANSHARPAARQGQKRGKGEGRGEEGWGGEGRVEAAVPPLHWHQRATVVCRSSTAAAAGENYFLRGGAIFLPQKSSPSTTIALSFHYFWLSLSLSFSLSRYLHFFSSRFRILPSVKRGF